MAELIGRVVPIDVLTECFCPKYATETKVGGVWKPCERALFPGYLIAVTNDPLTVEQHLLKIGDFARVLMQGDAFVPLAKEEVEIIGAFTNRGARVVPMSQAIKEGDRVVVTEGPLMGREYLIKSIDRHKSVAMLELNLCGRPMTTRVGLAVLSKTGTAQAQKSRDVSQGSVEECVAFHS